MYFSNCKVPIIEVVNCFGGLVVLMVVLVVTAVLVAEAVISGLDRIVIKSVSSVGIP